MPVYTYQCATCDTLAERFASISDYSADPTRICPECATPMGRFFQVAIAPVMQEHFSPSIGQNVSSQRTFNQKLREASDRATEETGIPHNYTPVDPREMAAAQDPVNIEGLERARRLRDPSSRKVTVIL